MKCSICKEEIGVELFEGGGSWAGGRNAQPINNGTCCQTCDEKYVYPARIKQHLDEGTNWKRIILEVPDEN